MAGKKNHKKQLRRIELPDNLIGILAGIATVLCCFWRIGLTNLFGDFGNAYYSIAFDWFFLLFVPVGLGTFHAVSSMALSRLERGSVKGAAKFVRLAALVGLVCCLGIWLLGFLLSDFLMGTVMGVPLAGLAFRGFLPALLPVILLLTLSGGMDGFGADKSVDFVRLVFCLLLFLAGPVFAVPFYEYGQKVGAFLQNEQYGAAYGALGGALGLLIAAVPGAVAALLAWWKMRPSIRHMALSDDGGKGEKALQAYQGIFLKSLPVLAPVFLISIGMIGQNLLFLRISKEEAQTNLLQIWGIYTGKVRVIFLLPIFLSVAFAMRMLPGLKVGYLKRNLKKSRERCMVTLRCATLFLVPAAVFMAVLAQPLMSAFFSTGDIETAALLMRIGCASVIFYGLAVALGAVLYSMDMTFSLILNTALAVVIHLFALFFLLELLDLGIYGVLYANIILAFALTLSFMFSVQRHIRIRISWLRIFLAPCMGGAVMAAVCAIVGLALLKNAPGTVNVLVSALTGFLAYFVTVVRIKGATPRELRAFWGGEKIIAVAKLLHIM
ncbi:MAG: polysaccharide biosynthesis C-terminal domain-containing protein [Eubacteriales bacterium]|nr:polysaccharide biosynthesis C-terminal domain-containing protein [Eubacteriales bacterium]